jgi:(p)ppGpp synthase/HD superfamily hydrolase
MIMKSILYIMEKHKGQKRMGGKPYVTHPIEVGEILERKGFDWTYIQTALFHDLLEDTDATEVEIEELSSKKVLKAVKLLTKVKGYVMKVYMLEISKNDIAKMVKLADRLHNLLSATVAKEAFRIRYIAETETYYLDLTKGTVFEQDINEALVALKATLPERSEE